MTWPVIPSLASGSAQAYDVTVTAPASGTFTNISASTATTPDPVPGNNNGSDPAGRVTSTVSELADVATSKTGPARVNAGDVVTYTITAHNLGPSDALAVVVSDPLPAGSAFITASNGGTVTGNVVQWPALATLPAGQTQTYTLQVRAPLSGTLSNVVSSTAGTIDPVPANNNGSQRGRAGRHHDRAGGSRDHQDLAAPVPGGHDRQLHADGAQRRQCADAWARSRWSTRSQPACGTPRLRAPGGAVVQAGRW